MKDVILVRGARQNNLKGFDVAIPRRRLTVVTGPSGSGKSSLAFDTVYAEGQRRYVESLSAYARQFLERMEKPDVDGVDGVSPAVAIEQKNPTRTSRSTVGTSTEVYDYLRLLWARIGRTYCPRCGRELKPDTVQSVTDTLLALPAGTRFIVAFPLKLSAQVTDAMVIENLLAQGFLRVVVSGELKTLEEAGEERIPLVRASSLLVVVDRLAVEPGAAGRIAEAVGTAFREGDGECVVVMRSEAGGQRPDLTAESRLTIDDRRMTIDDRRKTIDDRRLTIDDRRMTIDDRRKTIDDRRLTIDDRRLTIDDSRLAIDDSRLAIDELRFTERFECPNDGFGAPTPTPQLFSFNNPRGACPTCNGFGATLEYDEALIVPHPERSLREGAIDPWTKPRYEGRRRTLAAFAAREGIPMGKPWRELSTEQRQTLLHARTRSYKGILPFLADLEEKRYKQYIRVFLRQYQTAQTCATCGGARLQPDALNVRVGDRTIDRVSALPIDELRIWLRALVLTPFEREVASHVLREAMDRIDFLCDVGLGYITLDRATRTLSGGEAQRISLANALGSRLVDTLYVLDEPSIGLHPRDMDRLLSLLRRLRDSGNTVLVVEHDLEAIRMADHLIELGPGSGEQGGRIVFEGPVTDAGRSPLTGRYLSGLASIPVPQKRRPVSRSRLVLKGAREHNLKTVDVEIPLGALTVVTGVSGSGKSTLVHDVLYRALETKLAGEHSARRHLGERVGSYTALLGAEMLDAVVLIDQEPIGRTPRSNPVTYVKAYDEIRRIFASQPLARERRYTPGTFSFNVAGGRCDACEGAGVVQIEMVFMADVFVPCDTCGGRRFKPDVLEVTVKGKSIYDVLQLTVDQAIRFFAWEEKLGQTLWQLQQVGLGYLRLGQSATTLSGGEAQRIKIARELASGERRGGRKIYIMDEPTTGLHVDDIRKLAGVLDRLIDAGHTLVLIEHNLDVIKLADWVIDLGPEAGDAGGEVVAMGRPEDIARNPRSLTGQWLAPLLNAPVRALVTREL